MSNYRSSKRLTGFLLWPCLLVVACLCGCGNREVKAALDSDANGYVCAKCSEKFYTDRSVFANVCPKCKQADIVQVVGYYCEQDKHATLGPRGRGGRRCEKCGQATTGQIVPKESDYQAWGASKRSAADVGA
jgi:DNA-directed RNA polymerase subunit RPC12/RpoP